MEKIFSSALASFRLGLLKLQLIKVMNYKFLEKMVRNYDSTRKQLDTCY